MPMLQKARASAQELPPAGRQEVMRMTNMELLMLLLVIASVVLTVYYGSRK